MFGNHDDAVSDPDRPAGNRGERNIEPLTEVQTRQIELAVQDLGLEPSAVVITRSPSAYLESFDIIKMGPNSFPATSGPTTRSVFERLTPRAVLAHEAGHMITTRAGTDFPAGTMLDEFQASLVGRMLPGLGPVERFQLLRDAAERAKDAFQDARVLLGQLRHVLPE